MGSELPSCRERASAFPPVSPFSTPKQKFYCFKNSCNTSFGYLRKLANHDRFRHSRHPLTGGRFSENLVTEMSDDEGELVRRKVAKEIEEDEVYRKMLRMSHEFFEENTVLWKMDLGTR